MESNICIREIKEITDNLFDYIENVLKVENVSLDRVLYWNIDSDALYDIENDPTAKNLSIGDLLEDLKDLNSLRISSEFATTIHFRYLSSIFKYLSQTDDWFKNTPNTL